MAAWLGGVRGFTTVVVLVLSLFSPARGAAEPLLGGDWVGGFERDGAWVYLQIHFRQGKAGIEGSYDIPLEFTTGKPLAQVSLDSSGIRFALPRADRTLLFAGRLEGPAISGKVTEGGWQSSFRLDRIVNIRTDLDARQMGVWGASQGGWIAPLVASQSPAVTFVISQSGSGVSPEEQELYRSEAWLQADGFSPAEIQKAMVLIRARYECARTGRGWEPLAAAERAAESERWYPYTGGAAGKDDPFWDFWRLIHDYDPVPVLEQVKCPVPAVWGGRDTFVPVEKSVAVWRKSLARAGNEDVTLQVFPSGDHSLMEAKTGGLKEVPRLKGFVPGYFETQKDWLLRHVRVPR